MSVPLVAVLIPVLDRPENAAAVVQSLRDADTRARPVFICSPGDDAEIEAVIATGEPALIVPWTPGPGDWARKLNLVFPTVAEEWILLGADDLRFHPGWIDACLSTHTRTDACVIGTNDMGNARTMSGSHSTHPLVHRDYLECGTVDAEGIVLHPGYTHQYVDDEFVQTAMARRTWAHARTAYVEHLHPTWAKGEWDDTYRKGEEHKTRDMELFVSRKPLWETLYRRRF